MKAKTLFILGCSLFTFTAANAQFTAGRVIDAPYAGNYVQGADFDKSYGLMFSRSDYIFGTSRSASMAGAFTSLGADLSSMNINPAGLGMYKTFDWGITGRVSFNSTVTRSPNMAAGTFRSGGRNTTFGLNNFGFAWNISNRKDLSFTMGFSGNRAADFNSRSYVQTRNETSSIADVFVRQLTVMGKYDANTNPHPITAQMLDSYPFENENIYLDEWGAVLGYRSELIGGDDVGGYASNVLGISPNSYFMSVARGGIQEYNFSFGMGFSDIVYFGATVGVSDLNYLEKSLYEETFPGSGSVSSVMFDQTTSMRGQGVAAKLGVTVQPVTGLRIGFAAHLPTYWSTHSTYSGRMDVEGGISGYASTGVLESEQKFNTAPKLLAGISGVIGGRFLIAADYECALYNAIRARTSYFQDNRDSQLQFASIYKPGHTIRAGAELLLGKHFSLRAGGARSFDMMRKKNYMAPNIPAVRSSYSVTAGFGVEFKMFYLDLGYVFNRSLYTDYDFYYQDNGLGDPVIAQYDVVGGQNVLRRYTPLADRHMISLTIGGRF